MEKENQEGKDDVLENNCAMVKAENWINWKVNQINGGHKTATWPESYYCQSSMKTKYLHWVGVYLNKQHQLAANGTNNSTGRLHHASHHVIGWERLWIWPIRDGRRQIPVSRHDADTGSHTGRGLSEVICTFSHHKTSCSTIRLYAVVL